MILVRLSNFCFAGLVINNFNVCIGFVGRVVFGSGITNKYPGKKNCKEIGENATGKTNKKHKGRMKIQVQI